jgi:hypothetical protein
MGKRKERNVLPVAKGDVFAVTTAITFDDVDGDGVADCTFTQSTEKNGALFHTGVETWYGLGNDGVAAVKASLNKAGVASGSVTLTGFSKWIHHERKLTAALGHLNDAGDELVRTKHLD